MIFSLKKLLRKALKLCPRIIRDRIYRRLIVLPFHLSNEYLFKIAETKDEFEQAFKILHDSYVQEGFMDKDPSGMRLGYLHLLPSTTIIVAKYKNKVIGTMSITAEGYETLPLDKDFDVSGFADPAAKRGEIMGLAIHDDFRAQGGMILFALTKYIYEYSKIYLGVDIFQIATHPKRADFYCALFLFTPVEERVIRDASVNGAKMLALYLDLRMVPKRYEKIYGNKISKKNLYYFIVKFKSKNFIFPDRSVPRAFDNLLPACLMDNHFIADTNLHRRLSIEKKEKISKAYHSEDLKEALQLPLAQDQRRIRYVTNIEGYIILDIDQKHKKVMPIKVFDVSDGGLRFVTVKDIGEYPPKSKYRVHLRLQSSFGTIVRNIVLVWKEDKLLGVAFTDKNSRWDEYIFSLNRLLTKEKDEEMMREAA